MRGCARLANRRGRRIESRGQRRTSSFVVNDGEAVFLIYTTVDAINTTNHVQLGYSPVRWSKRR
eukprot:scaffold92131_cov35-Tisochrysis_lutea.AAC.1